jgi:hypothetical protein
LRQISARLLPGTHLEDVYYLAKENSDESILGTQERIIVSTKEHGKDQLQTMPCCGAENISFGSGSAEPQI